MDDLIIESEQAAQALRNGDERFRRIFEERPKTCPPAWDDKPIVGGRSTGKKVTHRGDETILLVEGDVGVRGWTRQVLQRCGYTVLEAGDGQEAKTLARHQESIHLLMTGIDMPHMPGRRLATELMARHPEMKVLYVSEYIDDVLMRHGFQSLAANYLRKPFSMDAVIRKVREILGQRSGFGP
jgi:CheY-like chemotaxis protein